MNLKYYPEDDILVIKTASEPYDHAEMVDNVVVHFTKNERPARIEILNASRFFSQQGEILPAAVKARYFSD